MAGSKVLQFCLLISFMITSTHALMVSLTNGKGKNGFIYEATINVRVDENGMRHYDGCDNNITYTARPATTKVIVYIKTYIQMIRETLKKCCEGIRESIANLLNVYNIELLYLAVHRFKFWDERLVGELLLRSIHPHPSQTNFQIDTIGENMVDLIYETSLGNLTKYQEDEEIFGGDLRGHLGNIDSDLCLTHLLSDDIFDGAEMDSE